MDSPIEGIIFLGPPGAGKGTQAELVAGKLGWERISTGDILREAVRKGTPLGLLAEKYIKRGELVPDSIVLSLVKEALRKVKRGFILDGFPRTLPQAEGLERVLKEEDAVLRSVVHIDVKDEVIVERLSKRRVCPSCEAVYNLSTNPPRGDEVCDRCGGKLEMRDDDRPETVKRRLEVYREKTEPLKGFYKKRGLLLLVNGEGDLESVQKRLLEKIAR